MDSALFIIDSDGAQINCGYVRSVERNISDESYERVCDYRVVDQHNVRSEQFAFSLYCSEKQYEFLREKICGGKRENFKSVASNGDTLEFSGYLKGLSVTCDRSGEITVELDISVLGRVTCESIRDINKMTNFEILEFLHRRLELE